LYLGEINDQQEGAWRKSLEVFDDERRSSRSLSLFPEDREIPADAVDSLQVKLSQLQLGRARPFGNCWLACELWGQLGLDRFWQERLPDGREAVSWGKVLQLLVINRLIDPGSELRVHRHWFLASAMDELLGVDFAVAEKDRLYRCLDRMLEHKQELFVWLRQKWADLFQADFEVLLYDLTSTYFEGEMEENPQARRGYSRDGRPDCLQVVIALVITTDGFPLAYEVMNGTADCTTLRGFLDKIEQTYGKAKRMWVMDRGIPTGGDSGRDAGSRPPDLLSGRDAEEQDQEARAEVARSALAQGSRFGRGQAVRARWRDVCTGQKRRPSSERNRNAAQADRAFVAQAACHATESAGTGSVAHAAGQPRRMLAARSVLSQIQIPAAGNPSRASRSDFQWTRRSSKTLRCAMVITCFGPT